MTSDELASRRIKLAEHLRQIIAPHPTSVVWFTNRYETWMTDYNFKLCILIDDHIFYVSFSEIVNNEYYKMSIVHNRFGEENYRVSIEDTVYSVAEYIIQTINRFLR